jgi:hypothetical protein
MQRQDQGFTAVFKDNREVIVTALGTGDTLKMSKAEFDNEFEKHPTKEDEWVPTEKAFSKVKVLQDILGQAVAQLLMANAAQARGTPNLAAAMTLSTLCDRFCKEFNATPMDFMQLVKKEHTKFVADSISDHGAWFNPKAHKVPSHLRTKNEGNREVLNQEREQRKSKVAEIVQPRDDSKMSIGDIIKGKQKK